MLQSGGGGGYLRWDGIGGFCGGRPGPEAIFLLKPLGPKGAGEEKAPAFALISELGGAVAVGSAAVDAFVSIPEEQLQQEGDSGAFLILQSGVAATDQQRPKWAEKEVRRPCVSGVQDCQFI